MDKQVGEVVAALEKLGLRQKTLVLFSGDNGTAVGYPSPVHGRMLNGFKGTMLEGGSRVPYIANWPGTTPAGKVSKDIVSFADQLPTFAELGGAKLPEGVKIDGESLAPQLRGQPGKPRAWAYVQLGPHWFVREPGWKMTERGDLFDMSEMRRLPRNRSRPMPIPRRAKPRAAGLPRRSRNSTPAQASRMQARGARAEQSRPNNRRKVGQELEKWL